jgi:D-alanyl-D-alanine carboxypeptidase
MRQIAFIRSIVAVCALASALVTPGITAAQAATPTSTSRLDDVLQSGLDRGLTGMVLYVEHGDEIIFDEAAGLASVENQTALATTDRFRIYSVTKTFTATLILQLVDEGLVSLDDTVTAWLGDPVVARIPNIEQITVRQLLTHTSGIYDYFDADSPFWQDAYLGEGADWSRVWTPEELLAYADGAIHAPYFAPGKGVHYSNTAYILLGMIVEKAAGQPFADRLHEQLLDPLGLSDTSFAADMPAPGGAVEGYQAIDGELVNVSATHLSAQWAEGGIVSTTRDLAQFTDALFGGSVLAPATLREMLAFAPSERPGIAWGMGTARVQTPSGDLIGMGGRGPGFAARMFRQPESDLTVVLLTNTNLDDDTVDVLFDRAVQAAVAAASP